MTILVTGGAGYIGSHMVFELLDQGEKVVVIDNLTTGFDWAVPDRAELVIGNIGDRKLVERVIRDLEVEAVIHFAGSVVVPESVEKPLDYYENNTGNSRNLLQAVVNCGLDKFIFSSTAAVYGTPLTTGPIREDAILNPMSPYGSSKLMTEIMVRDTALASNLRYVMLRYFNVAGCDPMKRTGQVPRRVSHRGSRLPNGSSKKSSTNLTPLAYRHVIAVSDGSYSTGIVSSELFAHWQRSSV